MTQHERQQEQWLVLARVVAKEPGHRLGSYVDALPTRTRELVLNEYRRAKRWHPGQNQ